MPTLRHSDWRGPPAGCEVAEAGGSACIRHCGPCSGCKSADDAGGVSGGILGAKAICIIKLGCHHHRAVVTTTVTTMRTPTRCRDSRDSDGIRTHAPPPTPPTGCQQKLPPNNSDGLGASDSDAGPGPALTGRKTTGRHARNVCDKFSTRGLSRMYWELMQLMCLRPLFIESAENPHRTDPPSRRRSSVGANGLF